MFSAVFSSFIFLTQGERHCVELLLSRYFSIISPIVVGIEKLCFYIRDFVVLEFWCCDWFGLVVVHWSRSTWTRPGHPSVCRCNEYWQRLGSKQAHHGMHAFVLYTFSCSIRWRLARGYKNDDECHFVDPCDLQIRAFMFHVLPWMPLW